ncbi:MAG: hypothetical protein E6G96_08840 [Alphaproteobacteria bacterium]|nr:MAG: hypothetical protein E6G96_08840 [Alphaproteobacteria bacterium]
MVASELGIVRVLIPRDPGAFSAHGMLVTDVQQEKSLTRITPMEQTSADEIEALFAKLEEAAVQDLVQERFARERVLTRRQAGMRYRGQSYEVPVAVPSLTHPQALAQLVERFHAAHQRRYGHRAATEAVEIVNFQVTAVGSIPKPRLKQFVAAAAGLTSPRDTRQVCFGATDAHDAPVWQRSDFSPAMRVVGPAVIEEKTSTIVLYPGQRAHVDEFLNVELELPH